MNRALQKDICYLKGVGPAKAEKLAHLSVFTVGDLIELYPRDYLDLTAVTPIATASYEEKCCVKATVTAPAKEKLLSGSRRLYLVTVDDGTAPLRLIFFNAKYTAESLRRGETYLFYGKMSGGFTAREMTAPQVFPADMSEGMQPVYPLTAGLSNKVLTGLVRTALAEVTDALPDPLPLAIRKQYGLMDFDKAVRCVHFPRNREEVSQARRRLIFDELLILQMGMRRLKGRSRGVTQVQITRDFTPEFWDSLPFNPTDAQRRVADEGVLDLQKATPMSRLIQGDVGSGKTAVAAALCHTVTQNGWQCAVMAPTEILARQHYETFTRFLAPFGLRVGLLVGSMKMSEKKAVLQGLADGTVHVAVGTHALLEDAVQFCALGLVITDEQHRFGVAQRGRLAAKGQEPHLLVMSATPIPRTLALMIYGDLDVSVIDELPPGRQPVRTYAVPTSYHARMYEYIRSFLRQDKQAYVVCPLVEEQEEGASDLISAEEHQKTLQKVFPEYTVGLLHGKMKSAEKERIMTAFEANDIRILVATTVVEVGVDVPNACVIVVENAERFGLSQLHQLRGRVGRGADDACCILVSDHKGEIARKRMDILKHTNNGFRIADEDLKLRGPGDFFGARQHGLPQMKLADLLTDASELHAAAQVATQMMDADPALLQPCHAALRERVERLTKQISIP